MCVSYPKTRNNELCDHTEKVMTGGHESAHEQALVSLTHTHTHWYSHLMAESIRMKMFINNGDENMYNNMYTKSKINRKIVGNIQM